MTNNEPARERPAGQIVRPEINGGTKVIRVSDNGRWSDEAEAIFLEELAATCNVRAAVAKAGFSTTAVYKRRMRWPGFAEDWARAIDQGYARLEAMMVERATDSLLRREERDAPEEGDAAQEEQENRDDVPFAQALNLLRLHRASARGGAPQNYRGRETAPDMDEIRASILRKIEAIERADALKA